MNRLNLKYFDNFFLLKSIMNNNSEFSDWILCNSILIVYSLLNVSILKFGNVERSKNDLLHLQKIHSAICKRCELE